jgi:RNA polymerase sigma factor (sigma-70 family)
MDAAGSGFDRRHATAGSLCRMMRSDDDLLRVPETLLSSLSEDELLRIVVLSRGAPSLASRGRTAWMELTTKDMDRINGLVASFRHPHSPGVMVPREDCGDVAQQVWMRLLRALGTFRGSATGEYRAFINRCVGFECQDHCRRLMKDDKQSAGSLDEIVRTEEGPGHGRFEKEIAGREQVRIQEEEAGQAESERLEKMRRCRDEAFEKLDEPYRRVLELTDQGKSAKAIAEELGVSVDVVYKRRERGLKQIAEDARRCLENDHS